MANDVIVAVQLDNQGRPLRFEIASFSGQEISSIVGSNRYETAALVAAMVKNGIQIQTLINTAGHTVLGGYLTVTDDANGEPIFGIDDRLGAGHKIKDLRRIR